MKKAILLFILLTVAKIVMACSCDSYESNFYKNITNASYYCIAKFDTMKYDYAVVGDQIENGRFIILDTIGEFGSAIGDTIVITGQDGLNCGEILHFFSKGDTIVLALKEAIYKPAEKDTFYLEGICGKYHLNLANGEDNGLSLTEIKNKITSIITSVDVIPSDKPLQTYPNPAQTKVTVASTTQGKLTLRNQIGQTLKSITIADGNNSTEINLENYASGIYFLTFENNTSKVTQKILVDR